MGGNINNNSSDFLGGSLFNVILLLIVISLQGWILVTNSTTNGGVGLEAKCNMSFLGFNKNNKNNSTTSSVVDDDNEKKKDAAATFEEDLFETDQEGTTTRSPIVPYNPNDPLPIPSSSKYPNVTVGICAVVNGNTASIYMDEWVDYHLLGVKFDELYIYDTSKEYVLQMWANNRRKSSFSRDGRIHVIPFHDHQGGGDYEMTCLQNYGHRVTYLSVMRNTPDEFFIMPEEYNVVADYLQDYRNNKNNNDKNKLPILKRYVFGTAKHQEYAPIPVLKRFQIRQVNNDGVREPFVMTKDLKLSKSDTGNDEKKKKQRFLKEEQQQQQEPKHPGYIYAFAYKSIGEWKRKGIDQEPLQGSVPDDKAWKRLIENVPRYAKFDEWNDYF